MSFAGSKRPLNGRPPFDVGDKAFHIALAEILQNALVRYRQGRSIGIFPFMASLVRVVAELILGHVPELSPDFLKKAMVRAREVVEFQRVRVFWGDPQIIAVPVGYELRPVRVFQRPVH